MSSSSSSSSSPSSSSSSSSLYLSLFNEWKAHLSVVSTQRLQDSLVKNYAGVSPSLAKKWCAEPSLPWPTATNTALRIDHQYGNLGIRRTDAAREPVGRSGSALELPL